MLAFYQGAFSWRELWEETAWRDVVWFHRGIPYYERCRQEPVALLSYQVARFMGGKTQFRDHLTGFAALHAGELYSGRVVRSVKLAIELGFMTAEHFDLLDYDDLKASGF